MLSNRVALAGLAALCVTAAGAGSYLAVRHSANTPEAALQAAAAPPLEMLGTSRNLSASPVEPGPAIERTVERPVERSTGASSLPRRSEAAAPRQSISETPSPSRSPQVPEPAIHQSRSTAPALSAPVVETPAANAPVEAPATSRQEELRPVQQAAVPEPPVQRAEELVVSADSVLGLKLESGVSSDKAKIEDRIEARVARDVQVGGTVVIPSGSRVAGSVTLVERGGRMKERARLGIRFHTLYLADGTQIPISTETLYRNGEERGTNSAAKIGGGAAAGAILGAIIGGAKGAAIGGGVGAGAGTAAVLASEPSIASFRPGTDITARILSPIPITIER